MTDTPPAAERAPLDLDATWARYARATDKYREIPDMADSVADVPALLDALTAATVCLASMRIELDAARAERRPANPPITIHFNGPSPVEQARAEGFAAGLAAGRRGPR